MDNATAPPVGTKGTVTGIDDTGLIMVDWDNGSELNILYGVDDVRKADNIREEQSRIGDCSLMWLCCLCCYR